MGNFSKAPYNFIPLNKSVVEAEEIPNFDFSKYHLDRFNGFIKLDIKTKTPLFIRGEGSNFFSAGGHVKIPGSSLRGMVRTLCEITSFGKFHFFDENKFYYRWIAETKNLRQYYFSKIRNVKGGYLICENNRFFIRPAQEKNGSTYEEFFDGSREFSYERQINGNWKVWSGRMQGKKRNWTIYEPNRRAEVIFLSDSDIHCYKNDENRKTKDLLDLAKNQQDFPEGVPIFYTRFMNSNNVKVIAFGHTKYFRLPYKYTISDHIPNNIKSENLTAFDFAEAIFGKESKWQTRVFFEDAELIDTQKNIFLEETSPKILASPRPTCFQHYLDQSIDNNQGIIKHWDDNDVQIRGYKLYWHRNTPERGKNSWNEELIINDTQHVKIKPIKPGINFQSRIRFENLSKVELGALLFVLDLPENCYHKIGMAKPLGLGSIHIQLKLCLIDRKKRYSSLFADDNWQLGVSESKLDDINEYKRIFEEYILKKIHHLDRNNANNLWNTPILKSLKIMLYWNNINQKDWLEKTRYLELNEFRKRNILPKPDEL